MRKNQIPPQRPDSDFHSKFTHEVRSPLNAIIGFSEMLHDGSFGPLTDPQREVAQDILQASRNLRQLVSDAMDLSKIHAGSMPLTCETLSLSQIVQQALSTTAAMASTRQTHLSHTVPAELAVTADERRLTQVLCNLLDNAVRFSPDGATVQLTAERQDAVVRVDVIDTGHGIPLDEQERVFEPFAAFDRQGQSSGTGLGLAVSRGLMELMGGKIDLVSTPGAGSTFSVSLRAAEIPA
ncbi:MAG: sensor histidine kinase [Armatimonadota bacterium]